MSLWENVKDFALGDNSDGEPSPGPEQFSTGPDKLDVDEEWRDLHFGFEAHQVRVAADDAVVVSFEKPWPHPAAHIALWNEDLPHVLGGNVVLGRERMWIRSESASTKFRVNARR